ncbi:MAG: hypothetical protein ACJ8D5_09900 [Sphingomicrobium sp.]
MPGNRIVAVGLLTQQELDLLGPTFTRAWPVDETPLFTGLIEAIDEADRELCRSREALPQADAMRRR